MRKHVIRAVVIAVSGLGLAVTSLLASGAMTVDHGSGTAGVDIGSDSAYVYIVAWGPHGPDIGFERAR